MHALTSTLTLALPRRVSQRAVTIALRLSGAALLVAIGLIHLDLASSYYLAAGYVGISFYAIGAGSLLAAGAVGVGVRGAWIVGALIAAGAFVGLLISASIGLPNFMDSLDAPRAMLSLWCEGAVVLAYAVASVYRHDPLGA